MRVLHLDTFREMRGGQWQVLRLHRGLIAAGHESVLLAPARSPLLWLAQQEGLPCAALRLTALRSLSSGYDIIHAHDARSHTLAALLSLTPLVVSRRVAFVIRDTAISRWKYRQPKLFLAVSHHVARQLRAADIDSSRIAVVYDGVPVPAESASGTAVLIPETTDPAKGMALAVQAAKIAGIEPQISASLETGLPHARILLYITHSEGLGSGILLAMAHGVTVIASNVGGIPELIRDGENGYLVPNDAKAIASALIGASDLGPAARATVLARFTEKHMVDATLAAYERVLNHG